jgi:hypothetical protein
MQVLWASTYGGGINKYDKNLLLFDVYHSKDTKSDALIQGIVTAFEENDKPGYG